MPESAPAAVQAATEAMIGVPVTILAPPPARANPLEDTETLFGTHSNAELAERAGFPNGPPGSDTRRAHRTFMRSLQRYRTGERHIDAGGRVARLIRELARRERRRQRDRATPRTLAAVARLIRELGLTVAIGAAIKVSQLSRPRRIRAQYIPPTSGALRSYCAAITEHDWEDATLALTAAWGAEYGIGQNVEWDDIDYLDLSIG